MLIEEIKYANYLIRALNLSCTFRVTKKQNKKKTKQNKTLNKTLEH